MDNKTCTELFQTVHDALEENIFFLLWRCPMMSREPSFFSLEEDSSSERSCIRELMCITFSSFDRKLQFSRRNGIDELKNLFKHF